MSSIQMHGVQSARGAGSADQGVSAAVELDVSGGLPPRQLRQRHFTR